MRYRIFAGMGGGYGSAVEQEEVFEGTLDEAEEYAYQVACEDFEGSQEAPSWEDYVSDAFSEDAPTESGYEEYFNNERESWIDYHVEEIK